MSDLDPERIRAALLAAKQSCDDALRLLPAPPAPESHPEREKQFMRVSAYAKSRGYIPGTISDWCKLGLPHIGQGQARRIRVREADDWIAAGGAKAAAAKAGALAFRKERAEAANG